jgi:RHS repeat-associated protein
MSVANVGARFARGFRLFGLWVLIFALALNAHAQSNEYGPPYNDGTFYPGTTVGIQYGSIGSAVAASSSGLQSLCPTCVIRVSYNQNGSGAAVDACLPNTTSCNPAQFTDIIFASDSPGNDARKNVGGCKVCATAGNSSPSGDSHATGSSGDGSDGKSPPGSTDAGDPYNIWTGNRFQQETDYRSPGRLTFRRFYNSSIVANTAELGPQWRHTFDRALEFIPAPGTTGAIATIEFDRPDGSRNLFQHASGLWQAMSDNPDTLTEQDDTNGVPLGYTAFISALRETERYSANGLLLSITEASGAVTTLQYSTATTPASQAPKPGLLLTVTDPNGRALAFSYDASARLINVALPDGGSLAYTYDSNGRLASVIYPDSHSRQYLYNEASLYVLSSTVQTGLTGVIDEKGTRYETTGYSSSGAVTFTYFANNIDKYTRSSSTTTTPLGDSYSINAFSYLGAFKVHSVGSICGNQCNQPWQGISYDANGYPSSYQDFNGNVTNTTYNAAGLETQRIEAKGSAVQRTINTTWDSTLRVPLTRAILNGSGTTVAQSGWVYNTRGQVLASCDMDPTIPVAASYVCSSTGTPPAGVRRTLSTYCDAVDGTQCPIVGLTLSGQDPRSNVTNYAYYLTDTASAKHGDLKTVTDALGHVTAFLSYDGNGRPTSIQDPNGVVTTLTYKPRGWLATLSVGGATTTYTYTPFGAVETVTDPDGVVLIYAYDDAHRLTKITDGAGNSIQYTLDASGNRTAENIYPAGSTTSVHSLTRHFNTLGQLTAVIDGLNHTVFNAGNSGNYDNNGNLVLSSDALGIQHRDTVDALNRVVSSVDNYNGSGTTQNTTNKLTYNSLDQLTTVTDPGNLVTHYTYDGLGNRTALQSPDTGASSDTYDAAGNRLTHTDARSITGTATYDALNRQIATTYPDASSNVVFDYDEANSVTGCASSAPIGRLTRIIESVVTTIYCYDARGNVIQKKQVTAAATDTISYTYTAADRLSSLTEPDGTVVTDTYNTLGQLTTVQVAPLGGTTQTAVSAATYLPFGPVASYTLGNGQAVARTYDANYNVSDVTSPALNLHFARDAMGNINALGNAPGANPAVETYSYDPLYRLTAITDSGAAVESYTYNSTGDRLSKTSTGGLATGAYGYQTGTHWLTSISNAARSYDSNGNTIGIASGGQTLGFGFDNRNRLSLVQSNQQTVATYVSNALGQRVAKTVVLPSSTNERFAYNEVSQIIGEYGALNRDYIWLGGVPVAIIDTVSGKASTVNFIIADGLGTPRVISDSAATTVWSWQYLTNSFGEKQPVSNVGYVFNLRSIGEYYDAESGLTYNGARVREAVTGRFIQSDPLGLAGGASTYASVGNNPLGYIDSDGTQAAGTVDNSNVDWAARSHSNNVLFQFVAFQVNIDHVNPPGDDSIQSVASPLEFAAAGALARGVRAASLICEATSAADDVTRVGRWMSQAEYDAMKASGKVQESFTGTTHVANPADASAFIKQADPGSLYVEFNVPNSSLKTTGTGWAKVIGPNSLEGRFAARQGLEIPQMPQATGIVHLATKIP